MERARRAGITIVITAILMLVCCLYAEAVSAETIEGDFYTFDTETGVMHIYGSVPNGESYSGFSRIERDSVKEIIFDETEEPITIGYYAFDYDAFRKLHKVVFSSSVKEIEERAFIAVNFSIRDYEIVFPESGLETIGEYAFSENEHLSESMTLPSTLKSVGESAFLNMQVQSLRLPEGIKYIGPKAFARVCHFEDMIGSDFSCMGGVLYDRSISTLYAYPYICPTGEYVAPNTLKAIAKGSFYRTKKLKAIVLPEGFRRIEDGAFETIESWDDYSLYYKRFYTMVVPTTLEYIGKDNNMYGLRDYFYRGTLEDRDKIRDSEGEPYFTEPDGSSWHFSYDIEQVSFPEVLNIAAGEKKLAQIEVSPAEASSDGAAACREKASGNIYWSGNIRDFDDQDITVYDANIEQTAAYVEGIHEGNALLTVQAFGHYRECIIHVEGTAPAPETDGPKAGDIVTYGGAGLKILNADTKTAAFTKAPNKKSVTVPGSFKYKGETFKVTQVNAKAFAKSKAISAVIGANVKTLKKYAFKGSKVKTITVKSKKLTKTSVKGSLSGSKVSTVKVKVGTKSVNKKYVAKYRKIFTKKNAGRRVAVK